MQHPTLMANRLTIGHERYLVVARCEPAYARRQHLADRARILQSVVGLGLNVKYRHERCDRFQKPHRDVGG